MKFTKTTLPNGLRVITIPVADSPSATVLALVQAGSEYESEAESGISHFLEHMVFKGTPRRPRASDISRELDSIGADYNAFTSQECTGYYAKADFRHADLALDIVADMYLNPSLDPAEMEKEKGVIVEEIRMYEDMPQAKAANLFTELVYGDQPAGRNVAGTEASVRAFSREALAAYRARRYSAPAMVVAVAGNFGEKSEQAMIAAVGTAFAGASALVPAGKPSVDDRQDAPRVRIGWKETDQAHIALGVRSFPAASPYRSALSVLATVLGRGMSSRLFAKLRDEMGVCYYVHAASELFSDHGLFGVSAGVDNARIDEVIRVILAELGRTAREPLPADELQKAKDYIAGNLLLSLETSDALAHFAGGNEILLGEIEPPAQAIARIRAVTAPDVMDVARRIFVDEHLSLAVVGAFKDEEWFRKLLTFK